MKQNKFRGINKETGEFVYGSYARMIEGARMFNAILSIEDGELIRYYIHEEKTIGQFTGLKDMNGVDIYEGDLLNIFYTSGDGSDIHDCIYKAVIGEFGDLRFNFIELLWIDNGLNQYPISSELCLQYKTLDTRYNSDSKRKYLCVPDRRGKNHLFGNTWKQEDESTYFELIGNIHQNPELLVSKELS